MDLLEALKPFFDFFIKFCEVELSIGGWTFSVGSLFLWSMLAVVLIGFMKGLAE